MNFRMLTILTWMLTIGAGIAWCGTTNSLYRKAEQESKARAMRGGMNNSVVTPAGTNNASQPKSVSRGPGVSVENASWITVHKPKPKDIQVHDLVTIMVHEVSKHSTKADTKAEREYSLDAKLADWIRLTGGALRPDKQNRGDPTVSFSFEREFDGKGDIKRQDTVTARIQAEVIDVLPNGNLVLEATHTVVTDDESMTITLNGICRGKDIGVDNTILSNQLARLDLHKHHKGIARDATKRGLISGLIDWLAPF
jgi:flagellar L-ring protein precursor FlgH